MPIQLEKLVAKLELDNKGFKAGVLGAAAGITALVAGITVAVKATMDWANDLDALGDVMDGSNKQFAALAFVARKSGVGVDALTRANTFMQKGLLKSNGTLDTVGKALRLYGINVKDINGNVLDSVQLTDEITKKYKSFNTQQERLNFLSDIYGSKTGPAMVDFFDTLAAEGGIDAVTKKVEALGLAIDPDRYEKFGRNLEELKLIGLGLAVTFTEKIMPAVEGLLQSFIDFKNNPDVQAFLAGAKAEVAKFLADPNVKRLTDFFAQPATSTKGGVVKKGKSQFQLWVEDAKKWLKNFNLDKFLEDALDFVENIDWDKVSNDLIAGISRIDWHAAGTAIGDFVMKALEVLDKIGEILWKLLKGAVENIDWGAVLDVISVAVINFIEGLAGVSKNQFVNMITGWGTSTREGVNTIVAAMQDLANKIKDKLEVIAKLFYDKASSWINQSIKGLADATPGLLGAVQVLVDKINEILKKVKGVTIGVSANIPGLTTPPSTAANLVNQGVPSTVANQLAGRATGGAVLAGKAYDVVELKKPEVFTPFMAGRIDPKKEQKWVFEINYNKLARAMVQQRLKAVN